MSNIREFPVNCPGTFQPCAGNACPIWNVIEAAECPLASNVEEAAEAVKEGLREAAKYLDSVGLSGLLQDPTRGDPGARVDWKKILKDLASLE